MIKFEGRFDEYAYRIATRKLSSTVTELTEGQWITLDSNGEVVISDGSKKSFMVISSKREGRDNITGNGGRATYLMGHFEVTTDQFDGAGSYDYMTPLVVDANGLLTPATTMTANTTTGAIKGNTPDQIVAYALGAPVDGFLRIAAGI